MLICAPFAIRTVRHRLHDARSKAWIVRAPGRHLLEPDPPSVRQDYSRYQQLLASRQAVEDEPDMTSWADLQAAQAAHESGARKVDFSRRPMDGYQSPRVD
jgi:hypothetical protein